MKKCSQCKVYLPLELFVKDASRGDGLCTKCKPCNSKRGKEYYIRKRKGLGKLPVPPPLRARREHLRDKMGRLMRDGCARCGYVKSPLALHLHHINPKEKENRAYNIAEAAKCIWLCANCHFEVHHALLNGEELYDYERIATFLWSEGKIPEAWLEE